MPIHFDLSPFTDGGADAHRERCTSPRSSEQDPRYRPTLETQAQKSSATDSGPHSHEALGATIDSQHLHECRSNLVQAELRDLTTEEIVNERAELIWNPGRGGEAWDDLMRRVCKEHSILFDSAYAQTPWARLFRQRVLRAFNEDTTPQSSPDSIEKTGAHGPPCRHKRTDNGDDEQDEGVAAQLS